MKICMQQPQYFPYIGFFHKLIQCDVCVILDDVEYSKNDFFNRNKIKTAQGWCWMTVPVKASNKDLIEDVKIDNNTPWKKKHLKSIEGNYSKAPYFKEYKEFLEEYFNKEWDSLLDLNMESLKFIAKKLKIPVKFVLASSLNIKSTRTQRLIDICKALKADTYISGLGAEDYMENGLFAENKIKLFYQDFENPAYPQQFGEFEPYMSILDLVLNCGNESRKIIENSGGLKNECISS